MNAPRILVVEDDPVLREVVVAALNTARYDVQAEPDGRNVAALLDSFRPDLAILDVRLPGPSGFAIAQRLRDRSQIPIIFLTAADTIEDRLAGFESGADDYVTKPFVTTELLARVRALLRRAGVTSSDTWQVEDVIVDEAARVARRAGTTLDLTRTEFDLLVALGRRAGKVVGKNELLATIWGFDDVDPNVVEVHISALRRKLEQHGTRVVQTVRGVGYSLRAA